MLKNGKLFRKVSIITYPLHASIAPIFFRILKFFTDDDIVIGIVNFIVTLMFCYVICWIIFKLEDNEHFKILRYSH